MTVIIANIENEDAFVADFSRKNPDVAIYQADDEAISELHSLGIIAFNANKSRIYVGRLVRDTTNIHNDLRALVRTLEPVAALASITLKEKFGIESGIDALRTTQAEAMRSQVRKD